MSFGLWEHDTLITEQFATLRRRGQHSPEKRLLMAVLLDAVDEYRELRQLPDSSHDPRMQRLERWFRSSNEKWPFSFAKLCEHLDLDPGYIWKQLSRAGTQD